MRHRLQHRRPAVENLEAHDVVSMVQGDVHDFSRRERFVMSALFLDTPNAVDRGMDPLINHYRQDCHDPGSVLRGGAPHLQVSFKRGGHNSYSTMTRSGLDTTQC